MHRTTRVPYVAFAGLALAFLLSGQPRLLGQAQPPAAQRPGALIVPINITQRLQMSSKKEIAKVENSNDTVLRVQAVATDPKTVLLTGQEAGLARLTLTDRDGKTETVDVVVQLDVEFLRTVIKRAIPTANVEPIPVSNNTIILKGTVAHAEDIEAILSAARGATNSQITNGMQVSGVQQVELCVTVAAVSRNQLRSMTFNFIGNSKNTFYGSTLGQAIVNPIVAGVTSPTLSIAPTLGAGLGTPNGTPTNLFFGVLHQGYGIINYLQALKEENVVKAIAEPKLIALSGRPASFLSGGEQAVPIPAGLGQVGVQFEEFGTRLNFLPLILGGGKIRLEVEPELSNLNNAFGTTIQGTVVPGRTTQRVHTTVELEDGQTFVIGGLIQKDVVATVSKVPVLGELPFLGAAFSSKSFNETEQELVIVVTPHLIDAMSCDQVTKVFPGQETRSPDDFELFLEGILEAPRGQREIDFPCGYTPAYKNGPTANRFPCGGDNGGNGRCSSCGKGGCSEVASPHASTVIAPANAPAASTSQATTPAPSINKDDGLNSATGAVPATPAAGTTRPTILPPRSAESDGERDLPQ